MPYREDLFTHTLNNLDVGRISREASQKLNELVVACRETTQKGTITIKLDVVPDKAGSGQYQIKPKVSIDKPTFPLPSTFMWGTPDGNLQAHHPDQGNLDLRNVASTTTETKIVEETQGDTKQVS